MKLLYLPGILRPVCLAAEAGLTDGEINQNSVDRSTEITLSNYTAHTISLGTIDNSKNTITTTTSIANGCGDTLATNSSCQIKLTASDLLDDSNPSEYINKTVVNYTPQGGQQAQASAETTVKTLTRIALSGNTSIEKPTDGSTKTADVRFTNKGPFLWQPSTEIGDYTINSDETPLPTWNSNSSESTCLSGQIIDVGASCVMQLQVDKDTAANDKNGDYIIVTKDNSNLAASSEPFSFNVIQADAVIAWSLDDGNTIIGQTDRQINIPIERTMTLLNQGEKPLMVTNITSDNPNVTIDAGCDGLTLNAKQSCQFTLSSSVDIEINNPATLSLSTNTPDDDIQNPNFKTLTNLIAIPTIFCDEKMPGQLFTSWDGKSYLVVEDGTEMYGIKNPTIRGNIIDGNQPVCTSKVTDMSAMFDNVQLFNQPIANWDTANVTDMSGMFFDAYAFNQPICNWDTANVTTMDDMFYNAWSFNQPIGNWNTANVTSMGGMFLGASLFNQPVGDWDTANVSDMASMFNGAQLFNQFIGNWDTANVTTMQNMFASASSFNQPIGNWDTANVLDMSRMFRNASDFNQNISQWNVAQVASSEEFALGSALEPVNMPDFSNPALF
jgi:surface protein